MMELCMSMGSLESRKCSWRQWAKLWSSVVSERAKIFMRRKMIWVVWWLKMGMMFSAINTHIHISSRRFSPPTVKPVSMNS